MSCHVQRHQCAFFYRQSIKHQPLLLKTIRHSGIMPHCVKSDSRDSNILVQREHRRKSTIRQCQLAIYAMHIAQRFVCAFFTLPHNMRDTSMHIDQCTVCCLCFWTHINLLWNHLNLWDDSSAWEMLSLLLFVSSKLFECFFRFLCRPCFLWALCFLWACFFGDCGGWPTVVVVIVD